MFNKLTFFSSLIVLSTPAFAWDESAKWDEVKIESAEVSREGAITISQCKSMRSREWIKYLQCTLHVEKKLKASLFSFRGGETIVRWSRNDGEVNYFMPQPPLFDLRFGKRPTAQYEAHVLPGGNDVRGFDVFLLRFAATSRVNGARALAKRPIEVRADSLSTSVRRNVAWVKAILSPHGE